jgi:hypothetical protein
MSDGIEPIQFAVDLLKRFPNSTRREWALGQLASAQARRGDCAAALKILRLIGSGETLLYALGGVVENCRMTGGLQKGIQALASVLSVALVDRKERLRLLGTCVAAGLLENALSIARSFREPCDQICGLAAVSLGLGRAKNRDSALGLLDEARELAVSIEDTADRNEALVDIAEAYAEMDERKLALEAVGLMDRPVYRLKPLATMVRRISKADQETEWRERFSVLASTVDSFIQSPEVVAEAWSLEAPVDAYLECGQLELALQTVNSIPENPYKAGFLLKVTQHL